MIDLRRRFVARYLAPRRQVLHRLLIFEEDRQRRCLLSNLVFAYSALLMRKDNVREKKEKFNDDQEQKKSKSIVQK